MAAGRSDRSRFEGESHTRGRGSLAEQVGVAWLERAGYRVVERNVDTGAGEIDVVAMDGDVLCFIEIKARADSSFGPAIEAVTRPKQRRLIRAASLYLNRLETIPECRFDVLGMDMGESGWEFTLLADAFTA